ncbi:MAG TPA: alpha/beta hydrolase [Gaiellales bacterium]
MPIGYLITTTLAGLLTFFAVLAPRTTRARRSTLRNWLGFMTNELPGILFVWLLASTLLAWSEGDLGSPVGLVALAVAVVTSAGLALAARRGAQAGAVVQRALAESLPGAPVSPVGRPPVVSSLLAPFAVRRRDVERLADIAYGDAGRLNTLDVYRRRSRPSGCPTLVYLHGGGFRSGRKSREARLLLYRLASRGWVCVSANYRLSPAARFPDHLVDAKKVIAWMREHGPRYGADASTLVVAGSSAGGNLAATAALTPNDPRFQAGFEDADTSVTAAVCLYTYYGSYHGGDPGQASSPLAYVHADAPPFFVAHGDRDMLVPAADAREFVRTLGAVSSNPVVYAELPGGQHTFDLYRSLRFGHVVAGIEAFAEWARAA